MKNVKQEWQGNRDIFDDSPKRYRGPWAEIGKYLPGKEPIRLQDSLPCPLMIKKKKYQQKKLLLQQYLQNCMSNPWQTNTIWFISVNLMKLHNDKNKPCGKMS